MEKFGLFEFLNRLENKKEISHGSNRKIQNYLDLNTRTLSRIFLILVGFYGLSFLCSGIFTWFVGDWMTYGKGIKIVLSLIPFLGGLGLYILANVKHKESVMWMELSTFFLALMTGASIFLIATTMQMEASAKELVQVWLLLIIPLLYIARASWVVLLFLSLNLIHLQPELGFLFRAKEPELITNSMYFWFFFLAYVPHFVINLDKASRRQSFRMIFLGWLTVITLIGGSVLAIKAGQWFWAPTILLGMYIVGKRFFAENASFLARPFQTSSLLLIAVLMITLANRTLFQFVLQFDSFDKMDFWTGEHYVHFILGILAFVGITAYIIKKKNENPEWNKLVTYLPFVMIFLVLVSYLDELKVIDMSWWAILVLNLYVFVLAFHAMFQGSNNNNIIYMFYGLIVMAQLMTSIYQNMDRASWIKGLFFIGVGGLFYIILMLFRDDLRTD